MGGVTVAACETVIMTPALWVCRLPEVAQMVERGLDCCAFRMGVVAGLQADVGAAGGMVFALCVRCCRAGG